MNNLSWLIYLAEMFDNLAKPVMAFGVIFGIIGILSWFVCTVERATHDEVRGIETAWTPYKKLVIPSILCLTLASLMPSKDTVYAIAASEVGEEVVQSETASKVVKALNNWLDDQIAGDAAVQSVEE